MAAFQSNDTLEEVSNRAGDQNNIIGGIIGDLTPASPLLRDLLSHDFTPARTLTGFPNSMKVIKELGVRS